MSIDLPPLIDLYVEIENSGEVEALSQCFTPNETRVIKLRRNLRRMPKEFD
jgi:hypothetical protein